MDREIRMYDLDLSDIAAPICLLEIKRVLNQMKKEECLRIKVTDPGLILSIRQLCQHSPDRLIDLESDGSRFYISVMKG